MHELEGNREKNDQDLQRQIYAEDIASRGDSCCVLGDVDMFERFVVGSSNQPGVLPHVLRSSGETCFCYRHGRGGVACVSEIQDPAVAVAAAAAAAAVSAAEAGSAAVATAPAISRARPRAPLCTAGVLRTVSRPACGSLCSGRCVVQRGCPPQLKSAMWRTIVHFNVSAETDLGRWGERGGRVEGH